MNSSTTPRRWALAVATLLFLFASQNVQGQCEDFVSAPVGPVTINLFLNATGDATLTTAVLNANGFVKNGACEYWLSQTPNDLGSYVNTPILFGCNDATSNPHVWYVRVGGSPLISDDSGPGATIVELHINVIDNLLPIKGAADLGTVTVNTSWMSIFPCSAFPAPPPCSVSNIYFLQACGGMAPDDIAIYGYQTPPSIPNDFQDNCLSNLTVTWQLSGATIRPETNAAGSIIEIIPNQYFDAGQDTYSLGTTFVTYRIYDDLADPAHLNPTVITATVTVVDDEDPMITCPANIAVNNDPGLCSAVVNYAAAVATDNCPGVMVSYSQNAGTAFPVGMTVVTATATDGSANTSTCTFKITVTDNEAPKITCPANLSVDADAVTCDYTAVGTELDLVSQSDNCALAMITNNQPGVGGTTLMGYVFALGTHTIEWEAEDIHSNTVTCSFTVTVEDVTPPPGPNAGTTIMVNVTPGDCSATVSYEYPGFLVYNPFDCTLLSLTEGPATVNGVVDPNFLNALTPFDPVCGRINFICGTGATLTFPVGETMIPYTWSDAEGNSTTEYITVIVKENVPPVAKCKPGTITLSLDATGQATLTTAMVDAGSTDNCNLDTLYLSATAFDCSDLPGTLMVTLTAEDAAGNTATCTATIDVVDNIAPQILCPGNKTVTTNSGCSAINIAGIGLSMAAPNVALTPGQYSDNCGVTMITWQLSGATTGSGAGSVPLATAFNKGVTTVTYTVKDDSGNNAVCNFSINVTDNTPPVWSGLGQAPGTTITVNANIGGCLAQVSWNEPTFTDACTPPVTVTKSHNPGAFFNFGTTTITYTALDGVGNATTHTFNVQVVDTQPPVANCKDITVSLDAMGSVTVTAPQVNNLSTDNCFFTFTSPSASYNCTTLGANNYTLQITDGSGNTATCIAQVTVQDVIPPVALCNNVSPINLDATGAFTLDATTVNNNSTDNTSPLCPLSYDISVDGSAFGPAFNFDCSFLGNRVLTLRVTDAAGNTATCSQIILVKDVTPPLITAPANTTVNCDDSTAPANTGTYSGLDDNCDPDPDVVQLPDGFINGSCDNEFTIIRSWMATDASGNTSVVSHTIFVQDIESPTFNIQSMIMVQTNSNDCDVPLDLELTQDSISDNCTSDFAEFDIFYTVDYPTPAYGYVDVTIPTPGSSIPFGAFPIGTTVVTWTIYDECGNSASKTVSVVVKDVTPPQFSAGYSTNCGKAYVLPNTTGACSNLFSWARPNFVFPDITDCLSFTVSEQISNPTVQTFLNLTNPFNFNAMASFQVFPTAQFPVGITTVSYVATDAAGNKSTCSFTVEIQDTQTPVLTCPPNQILSATCPSAQIPNYTNLVQVSDNCPSNVILTQSIPAGTTLGDIFAPDPPAAGSQFTITITGLDGYNSSSCSFDVTLEDGDAPIPTVAILPDLIDSCGSLIVFAPSALDPCNPNADTIYGTPSTPVGTFINSTPPAYQLNPGNYVITWVYNDGNGNISTQPQNITVLVDIFPPVAICAADLTLDLDAVTGKVAVLSTLLDNGSYDPNDCGPLTFSVSPDTLSCANAGPSPTTVTLTVYDHKNNTATCTTSITVKDVTPPTLSAPPADTTIEACDSIPPAVQLTSTDACAGTSMVSATEVSTQDTSGGMLKYNYMITRTWTTSDPAGNMTTATQKITVKDTKKPVFTGAPAMVMVVTDPDRQTCDDTVNINMLPFISDCATGPDLSVTNSKEPTDGGNLSAIFTVGTHTVVFTATDITGNSATFSVTVVVKDGTPPTAVCINGVSAALQPSGTVVVNVAQFNNNSSDNCSGILNLKIQRLDVSPLQTPSNTLTYSCADADGVTQHPVKLFVTDIVGNMSMCETFIVIQDNVDPTITLCPADATVLCTDTLPTQVYGTALANDNCPNNITITYTDALDSDTSGQFCYIVLREWTASDLAGNTSGCVQVFNVIDTIAPAFSQYPVDITVSCSEVLSGPLNITASDNCTDSIAVNFVQDTIDIAAGICGKYSYTIVRTRTAIDDCGNVETHTNKITVVDDEAPAFPGLPDTIVVKSANFPANTNCTVPVTLNATQFIVDCAPIDELLVLNDAPHGNDSLIASGDYEVGSYIIHFTATDPCGNVGMDSVLVMVMDNSKPTAICNNNVVISLGTDGTATIQADDIDLGSTDNCGIDTMFLDVATFDCADLGVQPVTLTVVDPYGNSNTCMVNVEVTLGNGAGFSLTATGTAESYFGADDGSAVAVATGGSGMFSFEWSNGEDTSAISGLNAGIYIVTVTDNGTGCMQTDTAIVLPGVKLTITAGTTSGSQGQIVLVPVTVDNFNNMLGVSFSMHVTNNVVGTILGGVDGGLLPGTLDLNMVGNNLTVFWANPVPFTLPNGSVIFFLEVQLSNAPVGSTSPVTIDGTPTVLSFQQDSSGVPVSTMAVLVDGMVTIDSVAIDEIEIAGLIKTWAGAGTPVPGVNVSLTGSVTASVTTAAPGTYSFMVPTGSNTTVAGSKTVTSNFSQGINVGDLLAIQNHAANVVTLTIPYQWVAGDVNGNNKVDLPDYLLVQQLILGTVQHYSNGAPDWKFIPASYTFPAPDPLSAPYPQSIMHTPATMDFLTDDFTAVRIGDVTGNAPVTNINQDAQSRSGDVFNFHIDEQAIKAGNLVTIPFKASGFTQRQAYQLTIDFDPNIFELEEIQPGVLPGLNLNNFGTAHLADGHLTTLWVNSQPLTLGEGEVLFTLTFRALGNSARLEDVLQPSSAITTAEALDTDGNSLNVAFTFGQASSNTDITGTTFELYQNRPNPFREQTTIGFRLPQAGKATLRVFSMDGRMVKLVTGNFTQGYNTVEFNKSELGAPGVYWYELETAANSDRKKMILID